MINSLFLEQNIQVIEDAGDWKSAVQKASKPLLVSNIITEKYVQNMIANVKKHGPYMVLADYFALMHARPGEGVNQMGMSLLVTKHSVDLFGKPIKIFLVMAAMDNTSHLDCLQKIVTIFMNEALYQTILEGNKDKIVSLFKESEGEK
ncbi:MAG: PTS sugar transporter subunit IIA [Sporolactobacillus sp.]